jgi:hypothetical protein
MTKITYPYSNIVDVIWILKDLLERLEDDVMSTYEIKKAIKLLEEK